MANIGQLVVNLEANIASFTRDMQRASQQTSDAMGRINGALDTARAGILALGAGGTVGAFAVVIKGAIDAADNLRDMSMKTGVGVESLNGLGFAASQAGGSLESMVAAAGKLNKSIAEAGSGNKETSTAFKLLGIDINDAAGNLKKADVVIAEVADKFAQYTDGPEKSAIALALFGKAGADMIPLLNEGGTALLENSEYAKKYGGATQELSEASDNFNDSMGKLTVQQKGFTNAMTAAVLPVLQAVADEMLGAAEEASAFALAGDILRTVLETFVVVGSEVSFTFKAVGTEIGGIAAQLAALASGDFQGFKFIGEAMKRDAAIARKEHDAFIARVLDRTPRLPAAVTPDKDKPNAPRLPSTAAPKKPDGDALNGYADRLRIVSSLDDEKIARQALSDGMKDSQNVLRDFADARRNEIEQAARAIQQNEANVDQIRFSLMSDVEREGEAHQLRLAELQMFHDAKLANVSEANALMEKEVARHEQAKADLQRANNIQSVAMAGDTASALYAVLEKAGKQKTALGKTLFLASKALAVAEILMNAHVAAEKAKGQMGIFGIPLSTVMLAQGYASAGIVAGMAIASAEGGYDIPAGTNPVTQLHEKEMVLPRAQADVIRGLATRGGAAGATIHYSPTIQVDSRTDQAQVHQIVSSAVRQGNAELVDRLTRAGRI